MARISIFTHNLAGGGAERMVVNLARGFSEEGHSVEIVLSSAVGPFIEKVPDPVRVHDLGAPRVRGFPVLGSLYPLIRYLRSTEPDVLLSLLSGPNVIAVLATRVANVGNSVIVSERSHLSSAVQGSETVTIKLLPILVQTAYPYADGIVPISEGVASDLTETCSLDRDWMDVIYNPVVTPELFELAEETVDHPWFSNEDFSVVIGVGRLTLAKDFPTLLRAFSQVRVDQEAKLVILGQGDERSTIDEQAASLGIEDDIWLPGFVENPFKYVSRADVFALSSAWEGFGNVLVESLACGTPVVSTDCPSGPAEILEDGRYGPLVHVGDDDALAEAIRNVLDDPIDSDLLRKRASDFTYDQIANQYLDVLLSSESKE